MLNIRHMLNIMNHCRYHYYSKLSISKYISEKYIHIYTNMYVCIFKMRLYVAAITDAYWSNVRMNACADVCSCRSIRPATETAWRFSFARVIRVIKYLPMTITDRSLHDDPLLQVRCLNLIGFFFYIKQKSIYYSAVYNNCQFFFSPISLLPK